MIPNFIKYLTDIRGHFTIKNKIAKNKVVSITIRPIIFFKSIIRLIQIIKIIIHIYIYIYTYIKGNFKILGGHGPHPCT